MRADIERWNVRYAGRAEDERGEVDPWLTEITARAPAGRALDVACGTGANALWLAGQGFEAFGVDCSVEGLRRAAAAARESGRSVHLLAADLDAWTPPRGHFALITVFRYLNRALVPALADALVPGGCLAWQTFNRNRRRRTPHFNPSYLLAPGELGVLTRGLEVLEIDDGHGDAPTSRVLARRPAA